MSGQRRATPRASAALAIDVGRSDRVDQRCDVERLIDYPQRSICVTNQTACGSATGRSRRSGRSCWLPAPADRALRRGHRRSMTSTGVNASLAGDDVHHLR
jgi:hypothetical protein